MLGRVKAVILPFWWLRAGVINGQGQERWTCLQQTDMNLARTGLPLTGFYGIL